MNEIPKVVFSKTMRRADWTHSRIASGDVEEEVARLKQESGKAILVHGGAEFAQSLSRRGLVDEFRLIVHPVIYFASVNYGLRFQESATSLIAPSGRCQAYLPYGQEGVLVQAIKVEEAAGLLATRYAPERQQESGLE